ncbi:MAG: hypothetical protein LBI16_01320, partial [Burkholderiales bacterium]|nr:hypothetical protein [Burkholderiales bacterium]
NRAACHGKRFASPTTRDFAHKLHRPRIILCYLQKQAYKGNIDGSDDNSDSFAGTFFLRAMILAEYFAETPLSSP